MPLDLLYRIEFKERVKKEDVPFIAKSALELIKRAIDQRLTVTPNQYGEALRYQYSGMRRLRVSDYRIIYRVDEIEHVVTIEAIGHRRDVYDQ